MSTPARRHFQRAAAAKQAASSNEGRPQTGDQYELMAAALWEARRTLKDIKSVEAKITKKRELLPQFDPYVTGVLAADKGAEDDVLMTCMVWLFDTGNLDRGLDIAEYALKHDLHTPDQYQRDTASLVAEQVADEALVMISDGTEHAGSPDIQALLDRAHRITEDHDMHDQIRAKLYKAIGYARRKAGLPEEALQALNRALQLNDRVGVKKDIEKLERDIKKNSDQTES